jgi:multiple sugar transport system substrate-binding protein
LVSVILVLPEGWGSAAGKIVLKFWDPDTRGDWVKAHNIVMDDYQKTHPDVSFSLTTVDWNLLMPKLTAAVAAGTAPDIYYLDSAGLAFGAYSQNLTQQVTDLIKKIGVDKWPKSVIEPITVDGQIIGFPLYTYPEVIWYRKDLFQQAGLKPPTTLDSLLKAAQALYKPPDMYGIALYNDLSNPDTVAEICAAFGCSLFDDKGNVTINSPETIKALSYLKKLWQTGSPDAISKNGMDARILFYLGRAAIMFTSVSLSNELSKPESKVKLGQAAAVSVPNDAKKVPSNGAEFAVLVIPKNAKNAEQAKEFLEFWATPEEMMKFGQNTVIGHIPVMRSVYDSKSPYWTSPRIAPFAEVLKAGIEGAAANGFTYGMYPKPNPCGPKVVASGVYTQMASHIVVDDWTPERTAAWAQDQIKQVCGK